MTNCLKKNVTHKSESKPHNSQRVITKHNNKVKQNEKMGKGHDQETHRRRTKNSQLAWLNLI